MGAGPTFIPLYWWAENWDDKWKSAVSFKLQIGNAVVDIDTNEHSSFVAEETKTEEIKRPEP